MSAQHLHLCPRCTGVEPCTATCLIRADLSDVEMFGDPRRCSICRKAGRSFSAPEVAAAAGCTSAEVLAAAKRGDVDLHSLSSVSRFIGMRTAHTAAFSGGCYQAALRELRAAGCAAQDLGFGLFLWAPIYKEGGLADIEPVLPGFAFAGELAGPLLLAARKHPRKPQLPLPPFSGLLQRLADRCERGQGYDQEAVRMRQQLAGAIGFDDPVLCRLQVRAARRKS